MKTIRIGSGAGYGGDRIEPALALMREGELDYIIFECLAERTIALAQLQKKRDPAKGYNDLFAYRMDKILDVWRQKRPRVITNMGAANPLAAAKLCVQMARQKGLSSLKVAAVTGDDVLDRLMHLRTGVGADGSNGLVTGAVAVRIRPCAGVPDDTDAAGDHALIEDG